MAESKSQETEKKSSKKLVLIIGLALLLLGAGAAGFYYFIYAPGDSGQSQNATEASASAKDNDERVQQEQAAPEVYYELSDPLVVNFPRGSSARIIKVAISVLVKGEASVESLKKHEPMIRNNLLMAISSMGADKAKTVEGKQELRTMMLNEIGKVLESMAGKNTAVEVYFTEFVMQ